MPTQPSPQAALRLRRVPTEKSEAPEDPALLAQAIANPAAEHLDPRVLAPTVAVAQAPIGDVLAALREAGSASAAAEPDADQRFQRVSRRAWEAGWV